VVLGVAGTDSTSSNVACRSGTLKRVWTGALLLLVVTTGGSGGLMVFLKTFCAGTGMRATSFLPLGP
jgi:hypothetical protein